MTKKRGTTISTRATKDDRSKKPGKAVGKKKAIKEDSDDSLPSVNELLNSPEKIHETIRALDKQLEKSVSQPKVAPNSILSMSLFSEGPLSDTPTSDAPDLLTAPKGLEEKSGHNLPEELIPLGTPVLALWKGNFFPAIVIGMHEDGACYHVRYFDDIENKRLSRKNVLTPQDEPFYTCPLFDAEQIQSQTDQSQSQLGLNSSLLINHIEEHWSHLCDVALGKVMTEKRKKFFESHRERVRLQFHIQRGPFSFQEYYSLCDLLWDKVSESFSNLKDGQGIFTEANITNADKSAKLSLLRSLTHSVLLPEFILKYVERLYPDCDPSSKLSELSAHDFDSKDYVSYLLSLRDMHKWAQSRKRAKNK